ncbi:hypothetical protein [Streptomyces sp. f51]|uniref:hypothetical protein n=1 Tax=Streptomyces sp. f51 TaxID=1827742 RepID=UPI00117CA646|nr:hypothetical protein [Streptomyces sp. f51]
MIPASVPHEALYALEDQYENKIPRIEFMTRAVVAWSADGRPLVPNHLGRLVPADELAGFREVRARVNGGDVVGVLPGGGWTMHMTDREGAYWEQPVIGWMVNRGGGIRAIVPDLDAWPEGTSYELGEYGLSHPDQTEVTPQESADDSPHD